MRRDFHELVRKRLPQLTRETADEIADHLADLYDDALREGAAEPDAFASALSALSDHAALVADPTAVGRRPSDAKSWQPGQSVGRSSRGGAMLVNLQRDMRYALHMLRRQPGFAAVTILTLTLGIGVNVAVFSTMRAALLASLPLPDPDRLVAIDSWTPQGGPHTDFSYPLYVEARDAGSGLAGIAGYLSDPVGIATADQRERVVAEFTTSNYFDVLRLRMQAGPGLNGADERRGAALVAVISDRLWRSAFAGAPDIVGDSLSVDGQSCTIVGVGPPGFTGFVRGQRADLWIPLNQFFPLRHRPDMLDRRTTSWMSLVGRLRDGVSAPQLEGALTSALREAAAENNADWRMRAMPASSGDTSLVEGLGRPLQLLMGVVSLILVIMAANLANLLLARSYARQAEMAVRQSLGASRARIAQQLVVEAIVLAAAGALGAVLAGTWVARAFEVRSAFGSTALNLSIRPDWAVIAFTIIITLLTALAIGVAPALGLRRVAATEALKTGGDAGRVVVSRARLRGALTIVQIALSLILVVGAGLFLRSLSKTRAIEPSMATDRTIAATLNTTLRGYDEARARQFYDAVLGGVSAQPGVESAALAFVLPVTAGGTRMNLRAGSTIPAVDAPIEFDMVPVSPGFFRATALPLLHGRDFSAADSAGAPRVIIVNERMASRLWPSRDAVGEVFTIGADERYTVVGIARDTKYRSLREAPRMTMYLPLSQFHESSVNLVVRSSLPVDVTIASMREAVRRADPAMPIYNVRTMAEHVDRSLYLDRLRARLISTLALLALAVGAVGIYGVVSYTVAQRTREIGIRLALGAEPSRIVALLVTGGARLAVAGIAIGTVLSVWLARGLAAQLYGVTPAEPIVIAGAALLLLAVAVLATYLPARRATRIDPMLAVRAE